MKKSELTVGVEYAVLRSAGAVRSWRSRSYRDKPIKAKIIDLDFKEMRMGQRRYSGSGILEETMVAGIAVDTGSKVYVKGDVRVRNKDGSPKLLPKSQRGYGSNHVTKSKQFSYDYLVLENAGCFISTWQDYLDDEKATKDAEAKRDAEEAAARQANTDGEADIKARVETVLDFFKSIGEVAIERTDWRGRSEDQPDSFEVTPKGSEDSLFRGEFVYGRSADGGDVLTGIRVGAGWRGGGLTLDAIEAIIGKAGA